MTVESEVGLGFEAITYAMVTELHKRSCPSKIAPLVWTPWSCGSSPRFIYIKVVSTWRCSTKLRSSRPSLKEYSMVSDVQLFDWHFTQAQCAVCRLRPALVLAHNMVSPREPP